MPEQKRLMDAYKKTKYQVVGHGPRNIQVLHDAFRQVDGELDSDIYGKGTVIEAFQDKLANYLGTEQAVFFPSGTMAQQIALRIWCDDANSRKVAYHPLAHLEIHEEDGMKELHHLEPVLLADKTRVIELEDIKGMPKDVAVVLLELPQREIGGQLPSFETLEAISQYCKQNNIKLHLDGARLFEVLPYYNRTAAEVCQLFDSVYVSFYKSIGGIAGAILAGNADFTERSVVWKRRHGGDLISLYPYIISADYYFDQRVDKMDGYYQSAVELARLFNSCPSLHTLPDTPVSNMFHVHIDLPKTQAESVFTEVYNEAEVGFIGALRETSADRCYFEVSIGDQYETIPKEKLKRAFELLASRLA